MFVLCRRKDWKQREVADHNVLHGSANRSELRNSQASQYISTWRTLRTMDIARATRDAHYHWQVVSSKLLHQLPATCRPACIAAELTRLANQLAACSDRPDEWRGTAELMSRIVNRLGPLTVAKMRTAKCMVCRGRTCMCITCGRVGRTRGPRCQPTRWRGCRGQQSSVCSVDRTGIRIQMVV